MKYLKNRGNLYYPLLSYTKATDTAEIRDPHTGKEFTLHDVKLCLKLGQFKVIKK